MRDKDLSYRESTYIQMRECKSIEIAIRSDSMSGAMAAPAVPKRTDVVVVGAGCIGASVAFHLAGRGLGVVLLEKGHIASGATGQRCPGPPALRGAPRDPTRPRELGVLPTVRRRDGLLVRLSDDRLPLWSADAGSAGFRRTARAAPARRRPGGPAEAGGSADPRAVARCRRLRSPRLRPGRGLRGPDRDGDRIGVRRGASRGDCSRGMRGTVDCDEAQER